MTIPWNRHSSFFQQTLEACGNLRNSVDSLFPLTQNTETYAPTRALRQPSLVIRSTLALKTETAIRSQDARKANYFPYAPRNLVSLVHALTIYRHLIRQA